VTDTDVVEEMLGIQVQDALLMALQSWYNDALLSAMKVSNPYKEPVVVS
jgi:hypothetical protein